jgi:hypothetical protein
MTFSKTKFSRILPTWVHWARAELHRFFESTSCSSTWSDLLNFSSLKLNFKVIIFQLRVRKYILFKNVTIILIQWLLSVNASWIYFNFKINLPLLNKYLKNRDNNCFNQEIGTIVTFFFFSFFYPVCLS